MSLTTELIIALIKVTAVILVILNIVPALIWLERKGAAYFQDRRGPNRARLFGSIRLGGMIHSLADAVKLITKEEFFPANANRFYFLLAPFVIVFVYLVTSAVIPFGDDLHLGNTVISLQVANLNVGILYIFSMASLTVYSTMLAGWSSNNKYSFLGGLRASSQMISYEITLSLAVVSLFMVAGSVNINDIVRNQTAQVWSWNVFRQPLAFLLFLIASFAETNRTPFDLPEGESELVAGYHVEYSSMKFAMFMMGEYIGIIIASAVIASLFFGGWQVPFLSTEELIAGAPSCLRWLGTGFSLFSILAGGYLVSRYYPSRYQDARKYEPLILGIPAILIGFLVGFLMLIYHPDNFPSWGAPVFAAALQGLTFLTKIIMGCFFFIWIRWTLPRFRYDQLMNFGWKGMLPLALVNIMLTGLFLLAVHS